MTTINLTLPAGLIEGGDYTLSPLVQPPSPPAVTGAVATWRFEEGAGTTTADSSGNANTGTLRNGASWTTGQVGGAIQLNGSTQDVVVADSPSLSITGTGLTLAAWIFPTQARQGAILHKESQYSVLRKADGSITYADSATWNYVAIGSYGTTPLNTWSHVAVTFDGGAIRFYINGQLVGTKNRAGTLTDNSNPVYLGNYPGTGYYFGGKLDEVQIFSRALSAQEILGLQTNAPIPAVDCVLSAWSSWSPVGEWSPCLGGTQSRDAIRVRQIITPPSGGGAVCGPTQETRTVSQSCGAGYVLPARKFVAFEQPDYDVGVRAINKHVNTVADPRNGIHYFFGGDYTDRKWGDDFKQTVHSLALAVRLANPGNKNAGWGKPWPYEGIVGLDAPMRPDWVGVAWDKRLNEIWIVPGLSAPWEPLRATQLANYQPIAGATAALNWPDTRFDWVSPDPVELDLSIAYTLAQDEATSLARGSVVSADFLKTFVRGVDYEAYEDTPTERRLTLHNLGGLSAACKIAIGANNRFPVSRDDMEPGVPVPTAPGFQVHQDCPATATHPGLRSWSTWTFDPTLRSDGYGRYTLQSNCIGLSTGQAAEGHHSYGITFDQRNQKIMKGLIAGNVDWFQKFDTTTKRWEKHIEAGTPTAAQGGGLVMAMGRKAHDPEHNVDYFLAWSALDGKPHLWRFNHPGNAYGKAPDSLTWLNSGPSAINGNIAFNSELIVMAWDVFNRCLLWHHYGNVVGEGGNLVPNDGSSAQGFIYTPGIPALEHLTGTPTGAWEEISVMVAPEHDICNGLSHALNSKPFPATGRNIDYDEFNRCFLLQGDSHVNDVTGLTVTHHYAVALSERPAWNVGQQPGELREIAGTRLSLAPEYPYAGDNGVAGKVDAWCGECVDTRTNEAFSPWDGGHADGRANAVYSINYSHDHPAWVERFKPSDLSSYSGTSDYMPDGSPVACHSYRNLSYVESLNKVFRFGQGSRAMGGTRGSKVDSFNTLTNTNDPAGTNADLPFAGSSSGGEWPVAKHPWTEDHFQCNGNGKIWKWPRSTQVHTEHSGIPPAGFDATYAGTAIDPTRGAKGTLLVMGGAGLPFAYDIATKGFTALTLTGDKAGTWDGTFAASELIVGQDSRVWNPGFFYSARLDCFFACESDIVTSDATSIRVTKFSKTDNPAVYKCEAFVTTGGSALRPPIHPLTRFYELPQWGVAIIHPRYADNSWALQLP